MPDIFDQIHTQNQGDIFDQIHAQNQKPYTGPDIAYSDQPLPSPLAPTASNPLPSTEWKPSNLIERTGAQVANLPSDILGGAGRLLIANALSGQEAGPSLAETEQKGQQFAQNVQSAIGTNIPAPTNIGEKAVDIGSNLAKQAAIAYATGGEGLLGQAGGMEVASDIYGGQPGVGGLSGLISGGIARIPAASMGMKGLRAGAEATANAAVTAASGGKPEDVAIAAGLPLALHGLHAMKGEAPSGVPKVGPNGQRIESVSVDPDTGGKIIKYAEPPRVTEEDVAREVQKQIDLNNQTIAKNKITLGKEESPIPSPNEPAPAKPNLGTTTIEAPPTVADKIKERLAAIGSEEAGSQPAIQTAMERSVLPKLEEAGSQLKRTAKNVSDFLGTGIGETSDETRVKNAVREAGGQQDLSRIRMQEDLAPAREALGKMSKDEQIKTIEAGERGESSDDPAIQKMYDYARTLSKQNATDGKSVGLDTEGYDDNYLGTRIAEFPPKQQGTGAPTSIAGNENYLKGRKFDSYGEYRQAVEDAGGKMRDDNPVDTMIRKQMEVRKSIDARRIVMDEQARGSIQAHRAGEPIPDGYKPLDDRLSQKLVKTQLWTDKDGNPRMRPGQLIAPEPLANTLDQIIAPGVGRTLPIIEAIKNTKRVAAQSNFALSAYHLTMESMGNAYTSIGQALDNALHGELGLAGKNLARALPWNQVKFGSAIRETARNASAHPAFEPLVQATANAGGRFGIRSVLDPTAWEKARTDFAANDPLTGTAHVLQGIAETPSRAIMERFVPNMKAGGMAARAETGIARGLQGNDLKEFMRQGGDNLDNVLGQVVRSNQFQHRVVQDVADSIFSAPKFSEGALRFGGALARDTAKAFSDVVHGQKPSLTPAMYTTAGFVITHALLGSAIQAAYTTATTGKPIMPTGIKDYFFPRTGRKNADGTDERIHLPNPFDLFSSTMTEGPKKAFMNRVSPLWRAAMDIAYNADYRNTQVREGGILPQIGQSATHMGKALLPFSVENAVNASPIEQNRPTDIKMLGFAGITHAPNRVSQSPAEQTFHDLSFSKLPAQPRTREQAAKSDAESQLRLAMKNRAPNTYSMIQKNLNDGTLTREDVKRIRDESSGPGGFAREIQQSKLEPADLMQVWAKASPGERKSIQWSIRGKIGRSTSLTAAQKQAMFEQLRQK